MSLFNTKDGELFTGVFADMGKTVVLDNPIHKAEKGTPQYEEWLRKYREKRGKKVDPDEAKNILKDKGEDQEFKKYTSAQISSDLKDLGVQKTIEDILSDKVKTGKVKEFTYSINGTDLKIEAEHFKTSDNKDRFQIYVRYPEDSNLPYGPRDIVTGGSIDAGMNELSTLISRRNSSGKMGGESTKRFNKLKESVRAGAATQINNPKSQEHLNKLANTTIATYKQAVKDRDKFGIYPQISSDLLYSSKELKNNATKQMTEFVRQKFLGDPNLKKYNIGSWLPEDYNKFVNDNFKDDAVFLSTNAFRRLSQDLASTHGKISNVVSPSSPMGESTPKPVFKRDAFFKPEDKPSGTVSY